MSSLQIQSPPLPKDQARDILGAFATGVAVVTARDGDTSVGVTVNSLTSVSLNPPSLLVSLDNRLHTLEVIRRTQWFGVNILRRGQGDLATHFAARKEKKFLDVAHHHGMQRVPVLDEQMAHAVCQVSQVLEVHDHTLVIGILVEGQRPSSDPLVYFERRFGGMD